jgi:hydrogenase nickel incorporation protein HypB
MHHIDVHVRKDIYDVNNRIADANADHLKAHGIRRSTSSRHRVGKTP